MAKLSTDELLDAFKEMTLIELSEFVSLFEETFGVTAAAPVAVARAAGLHCSRVDGSPLVYNESDTSLPDLIVCRPELAEEIIAFVRAHGTD